MWGAPCELQYLCSNSKNLQVSASAEAPALEEYKYSASVVFIVTPETGDDKYMKNQQLMRGAHTQSVVGVHQV